MDEGTRLESVRRLTPTVGSNPTPSATFTLGIYLYSEYIFAHVIIRSWITCLWLHLGFSGPAHNNSLLFQNRSVSAPTEECPEY